MVSMKAPCQVCDRDIEVGPAGDFVSSDLSEVVCDECAKKCSVCHGGGCAECLMSKAEYEEER